MATRNSNGEIIQIYSIAPDFDFQEVDAIIQSHENRVKYWVTEYCNKQHRWPLYKYEWLNQHGNPVPGLQNSGWKMFNFSSHGDKGYIVFNGCDPQGRVVSKSTGNRIQGIVNAISFLNEVSQFNSWEQYQLLKENEALQAKLELLTQEKNKLEAMLDNSE